MIDYTAVGIHDFYTFLLVLARVSGLIVTAPLFNSHSIPRSVKAAFSLILSLALVPLAIPQTGAVPPQILILFGDIFKNALFGLALGYMTRVLFSAVEMAGFFVDTQMGFGLMQLMNPFSEHPDSVLSIFQFQMAFVLYLLMNGHLILLDALAQSFVLVSPSAVSPQGSIGMAFVPMLTQMFALGFKLALPAAGVLVVVDVAFGLVARLVPQVNVFIVGTPAKIIFGLATVALMLPGIAVIVGEITAGTAVSLHALAAGSK